MSTAKELPIPMRAQMVVATLRADGPKTQTRRALRIQPPQGFKASAGGQPSCMHYTKGAQRDGFGWDLGRSDGSQRFWPSMTESVSCPYGQRGDRLWVKENHRYCKSLDGNSPSKIGELCLDAGYKRPWAPLLYEADGTTRDWISVTQHRSLPEAGKLRPSMFMTRWASRILLEVISVRVEHLQDISEADCIAEGIERLSSGFWRLYGTKEASATYSPKASYRSLWELINGAGSWALNPWVWVVEFKRIAPSSSPITTLKISQGKP